MILNHCRLIAPLSGGTSTEDGAVVIENGVIQAVCASPAASGFDCGGKTLLPGLIDLHTHITGLTDLDWKDDAALAHQAGLYLAHGFTTIRDCGSLDRAANHLRDRIAAGKCAGPRIIACGRILTPTEVPENDPLMPMYSIADGKYEFLKAARREFAEGGDFLKIMASGSAFHPGGIPNQPLLLDEELEMAVRAAQMKGSSVAAHAHADAAIARCARLGVHTIEHATYISAETIELIKNTPNCYLVPTLAAMYVSVPDESGFWSRRLGEMLRQCADNIRRAYLAGLKPGFGTDSSADMPQYEQGIEFRYRSELCGMKNIDILLQATKYSAEILGLSDEIGEIRSGLQADLILVDGNPDQNISVMYHLPDQVWKDGTRI